MQIIQEYLFIADEFKDEIESMAVPKEISREIESVENSSCWTLKLSVASGDEGAAKLLSEFTDGFCEKYKATVLTDDCSAYFNKRLYPIVNEFERKLRKLLYLASALNGAEDVKKAINNLESQNLDTIFNTLFFDMSYIKNVRSAVNQAKTPIRQEDLMKEVNAIQESILWETLIGKNSVPTLQKMHKELREYRNDVMHAHNINILKFREAKNLFTKVNKELDKTIECLKCAKENNEQLTASDFNESMIEALKAVDKMFGKKNMLNLIDRLNMFAEQLGLIKNDEEIDDEY